MDVQFIHDPHQNMAFSQPLWEDCDLVLDPSAIFSPQSFWAEKAIEVGWRKPDWWKDVSERGRRVALMNPKLALRAMLSADAGRSVGMLKFALGSLHLVNLLSQFDFLVLIGVGPVYGKLAGVPYIAIPLGQDITWLPFQNDVVGRLQKSAYAQARRILVYDWRHIDSLCTLNLSDRWTFFSFPIDAGKYARRDSMDKDEVFDWLPAGVRDKFVFFMPSSQEFRLKGTDKALRAFLKLSHERDDVALVTPSWGQDTARAKQIVKQGSGEDSVVFLPYVVSRPLLIKFYRVSNVVVDQFVLGSYGFSVLEAMACERAVIGHINSNRYRPYLRRLPPNLQAYTEQEIYDKMRWAVENPDGLMTIARESREWVMDQHSPDSVQTLEKAICEEA